MKKKIKGNVFEFEEKDEYVPKRKYLPVDRKSVTKKFVILNSVDDFIATDIKENKDDVEFLYKRRCVSLEGFLTVGFYDDGKPGELFLKLGKAGDIWSAYDMLMISISVGLQYGIPIEVFIRKFQHMRFPPDGMTLSSDIPIAKSIPDYIARYLKTIFPLHEDDVDENIGYKGKIE